MHPRHLKSRQSKSFRVRRRIRAITASGLFVVLLGLIIFAFSYLSSLPALSIINVVISGTDKGQSEIIHSAVIEALQGKYFGILARSSAFIYPKATIKTEIKKSFLDVEDVTIERDGLKTLTVSVSEKTPSALICNTLPDFNGNELSLEDPGSCYFVDSDGLIFKKSPSFSGSPYNRYYTPDLASTSLIGLYATSTSKFSALQKFYNSAKNNGISVEAILINNSNEYELYAKNPIISKASVNANSGASTVVIYFNDSSSLEDQLSNLISFWVNMVNTAETKNKSLEFDYIDVRYGANVFYTEVK